MLTLKYFIVLLSFVLCTSSIKAQSDVIEIRNEMLDIFLLNDLTSLKEEYRISFQQIRNEFGWNNVKPEEVIEINDSVIQARFLEHHFTKAKKEELSEIRNGVKLPVYIFYYYRVRNYYVVVQVLEGFAKPLGTLA